MYTDDCEMTTGLMHALMKTPLESLDKDRMVIIFSRDIQHRMGKIDFWREEYLKARFHYLLSYIWSLCGVGKNKHKMNH